MWTALMVAAAATLGGAGWLWRKRTRVTRPTVSLRLKLGHAFPHPKDNAADDPVESTLDLLLGRTQLGPRTPMEPGVVSTAEDWLGIKPDRRPVYTYLGHLHPEMGKVGLIIGHGWFLRDAHGVSRCDTGGLAGRVGGFACLSSDDARKAVDQLIHPATAPWEIMFEEEVRGAYAADCRLYLAGQVPDASAMDAFRRRCIESVRAASSALDRRLWTWEVRGFANVTADDIDAVVLAPEAFKELNAGLGTTRPPGRITIIAGTVGPAGVYFMEARVLEAFVMTVP